MCIRDRATSAQIRRGFEEVASRHRPDAGGGADPVRHNHLAAARDILLGQQKRARHDRAGKEPFEE
eukprot:336090-Pyramimonas_sp.AAC.1